eukprot:Colp12_sorted_trinity150504_noHs@19524
MVHLEGQEPDVISTMFYTGWDYVTQFLQEYGWYFVGLVITLYLLKDKFIGKALVHVEPEVDPVVAEQQRLAVVRNRENLLKRVELEAKLKREALEAAKKEKEALKKQEGVKGKEPEDDSCSGG